ncbi:family 16 glycoside hydrolase [Aureliella helgolandensis]|uniref:3-keto-alpha-glucoside-1,2-lyase/3-keto-2-hydroxy-glucal hydratase domain-containing protein n=1 Tax=Aureliella helgolandensis TaxID=2527968 RepID=A0A518G1S7_9BACT|nr:hypothetical protein [Aureliella helgolandensis]QDV22480.1 hypothetical protein Q31a_07660 [Aureliella helgolandensis]
MKPSKSHLALTFYLLASSILPHPASANEPEATMDSTDLLGGKRLRDGDGEPRFWHVEDGVILGQTKIDSGPDENTPLLQQERKFSDLKLQLSYQVEGHNAGVQYRCVDQGEWVVYGYPWDSEARWHALDQNPNALLVDECSGGSGLLLKTTSTDTVEQSVPPATGKINTPQETPVPEDLLNGTVVPTEDTVDESADGTPTFKVETPASPHFHENSGSSLSSLIADNSTASNTPACSSPQPLSIDVWYGSRQRFGHQGNPQRWINVLGRLRGHDDSAVLEYSLNGGARKTLTIGPNKTRLANLGDFNVEIDRIDLRTGHNSLVLFARDGQDEINTNVAIVYATPSTTQLPLHIDWSSVKDIQDVAQVTDGLWKLTPGGVRVIEPYYDRVIAFGDESWMNYEVTVPVTFHGFRKPGPDDGGRNVVHAAIAVRWPGHAIDAPPTQPNTKWYPLGATAEFMIQDHPQECRWRILGGRKKNVMEDSPRKIEFDKRYMMKHRVESTTESTTTYRVKFWDAEQPEPKEWDVTTSEEADVANGGALLLAHYADVTFGNVTVTPCSDLKPTVDEPHPNLPATTE